MDWIILALSFILGGLLTGLLVYNWVISSSGFVRTQSLSERYIPKELATEWENRVQAAQVELDAKTLKIIELNKDLASQEQIGLNLEEKLNHQKAEVENLQRAFQSEFENVANRLLEEKSQRFSQQNQQQIGDLLTPLRERIHEFEAQFERKFLDDTKQRASLKTEIESLRQLNQQLSHDAHNLTNALRGDSKTQGDWGEFQLEKLLEKAGLLRGVHYEPQLSFDNGNGQQRRPDFVIQLPENKQLILDSKVSLTAYEQFFSADDPTLKTRHLKSHIDSLRTHVKSLGEKNYVGLYAMNTLDYVIMFVPIEPAWAVAMQEDSSLFTDALDRNVVVVTPSTLLATMRTVNFIWKQDNQKRYALEIARQSGLLYDKFVAFVDDLKQVGTRLDAAQNAYNDALNKLSDSKKYGDTLIGRAERVRELGAKATKRLPKELLDRALETTEEVEFEEGQL
jgi:DNA recombination protein RmuC